MHPENEQTIDTADTVLHHPTGEKWVVAYVRGNHIAWCGWPEGEANLSDCTLVEKASPEVRELLLHQMANMSGTDARRRYAIERLQRKDDTPCPSPQQSTR